MVDGGGHGVLLRYQGTALARATTSCVVVPE